MSKVTGSYPSLTGEKEYALRSESSGNVVLMRRNQFMDGRWGNWHDIAEFGGYHMEAKSVLEFLNGVRA